MRLSWHQAYLIHWARAFSHQFLPSKSDCQGIVKGQTPAPLTTEKEKKINIQKINIDNNYTTVEIPQQVITVA